jgi:hypothetical protein
MRPYVQIPVPNKKMNNKEGENKGAFTVRREVESRGQVRKTSSCCVS